MALFFDAEWFNARLAERLLSPEALAAASGMDLADLALVFKDQRELSAAEVAVFAEMLGATPGEIALHAGVSTPIPNDGGGFGQPSGGARGAGGAVGGGLGGSRPFPLEGGRVGLGVAAYRRRSARPAGDVRAITRMTEPTAGPSQGRGAVPPPSPALLPEG